MANFTRDVDNVFLYISGIGFFLLLLITFLMLFFIFKYRSSKNKEAEDVKDNIVLEITWTLIPTVIVLSMFYYGFYVFKKMRYIPPDAYEIKVTGRQWSWLFEYENGFKSDTLYLLLNKPVKLTMKTMDVIHSLYIPAFRIKEDLPPGYETYISLTPKDTGTYDLLCAEYCGDLHSYMVTKVKVLEEEKFYSKIKGEKELEEKVEKTEEKIEAPGKKEEKLDFDINLVDKGKKLVSEKVCIACHSTDGSRLIGPSFKGMYGKKEVVVSAGKEVEIVADDEYLKESILEPAKKVVKGYENLMPPSELKEEELKAIIEYIKSLK
ncbi:MAG: cytochrome c oxidase subunit II [candidate division WOR-3 bacterium]